MVILAMSEIKLLNVQKTGRILRTVTQQNITIIFCRIPYAVVQGEILITNLVRKLKRHLDRPFKLRNIYQTKKYYCNRRDKVPEYLKSHLVYEFCCPACNNRYVGKTGRNLGTRVQEHSGSDKKSLFYNYLLECEHFDLVVNLQSLPSSNSSVEYLEHVKFFCL